MVSPRTISHVTSSRRGTPWTLILGLGLIAVCEALLALDVHRRGGLVVPLPPGRHLPLPTDDLGWVARNVAENMTVFCWVGYLLTFDGLLTALARRRQRRHPAEGDHRISSIRARPNRFVVAWLSSIPVWCFYDAVNFYFMHAWRYHGLPPDASDRYVGYFIAFAAISPGMFLAAQLYQYLGTRHWRTTGVRIPLGVQVGCFLLGVAFIVYPFLMPDPIANLTLWVSLIFLLDPLNHWLGAPSILGDWRAGRWGRTLALMGGGATCGLCWEFWNYWAIGKWTYSLPFLGSLQHYRYFEMPLLGFLGFLPFALACWIALNTILAIFELLRLRVVEPLPDDDAVL